MIKPKIVVTAVAGVNMPSVYRSGCQSECLNCGWKRPTAGAPDQSKDFQIRAFDGELCQIADTPLAVKPTRAAIAT